MKIEQVAVQLYTLREHLKFPSEIEQTLHRVRALGYQAVQVSGMGPIPEETLTRLLGDEGLTLCATHEPAMQILNEPERVVERLQKLGCKYTAYPRPAGVDLADRKQVERLAARLNHAGEVLHAAGQVLAYHNHANELHRFDDATVLDYLYGQTDPRFLQAEPDTYWLQHGGGDPVKWCEKLKGRLPLLHLKDYQVDSRGEPSFAEIGAGNLDFPAIVAAAETSGCLWFIVEQDTCPGDPFDSLQQSFDYISEKLCD